MTNQHRHRWELAQDLIVDGMQVADAHECTTCPATKWSANSEYRDAWKRTLGLTTGTAE